MNKAQKQVQQVQLDSEQKTIRQLQRVYEQAKKDTERKISELSSRTDLENLQSIVYQKQYQEAIKKQLEGVLDDLQGKQFTTVADYLQESYHNGYVGVMYDLTKQGIPVIMPINQEQVVKALQTDSKISQGLYSRMGEDVQYLKRSIRAELSRGIAQGSSWNEIAGRIANGMNSPYRKALNRTILIARTEGHRIQQQSALDAQYRAKEKGADVVKQWDSTLDNRTRPHHRRLDGQIRELDEPFEVDGLKAAAPGQFGRASEDCNCRCCLLQRARWALDEDELDELKERAAFFGLDKSEDFEDFKKKYLKLPDNADTIKVEKALNSPIKSKEEHYSALLTKLEDMKVKYNPVKNHTTQLTDEEIISTLCGGDNTSGSCASVGLAYIGQKQGWNVLDFRGNESQKFFSQSLNLYNLSCADGIKTLKADGKSSVTVGNRLLKQCEEGKEYYLVVGRHASIVRKKDSKLQYLELQSANRSGWTDFDGNTRYTLSSRFGCTSRSDYGVSSKYDFMIDIAESDFSTDDFRSLIGFINTAEDAQRKGKYGTIK